MSLSACIVYWFKYFEMGLIKYDVFISNAFELLNIEKLFPSVQTFSQCVSISPLPPMLPEIAL